MPSVASEVRQTLSAQAQRPGPRPQTEAGAQDSSPFAELLDSTGPTDDTPPPAPSAPPARLTSSNQANPSTEPRDTAPAENNRADGGSADQDADAADGQADNDTGTVITGVVAADANAKAGKAIKAAADASTPDTDSKTAGPDAAATPAVVPPDVANPAPVAVIPALPAPALPATAASGAAASDTAPPEQAGPPALNALQAAQAVGVTAPKPAPGSKNISAPATSDAKSGDQAADAAAPDAGTIDPQTAAPQPDAAGKDAQGHANNEVIPVTLRRAAELLKAVEPGASAPRDTDATGGVKAGADAVQNLGIATQAGPTNAGTNATGTVVANAQAQTQPAAIPLAGLAVEIAAQANAGNHRFEIRLDPPELGRIDVRLNVDRNGNVSTQLVADRSDTLDLLRRDSGQLQQALQDAGLKTSDNALQFSLRQQGFTQDDAQSQNNSGSTTQAIVSDDDPAPIEALRQGYGRLLGLGGGLDIRV